MLNFPFPPPRGSPATPEFPTPVAIPPQAAANQLMEVMQAGLQQLHLKLDTTAAETQREAEAQRRRDREETEAALAVLRQERAELEELAGRQRTEAEAQREAAQAEIAARVEAAVQEALSKANAEQAAQKEEAREARLKEEAALQEARQESTDLRRQFQKIHRGMQARLEAEREKVAHLETKLSAGAGPSTPPPPSDAGEPSPRRTPPLPSALSEPTDPPDERLDAPLEVYVAVRRAILVNTVPQAEVALMRVGVESRLPVVEAKTWKVRHWPDLLEEAEFQPLIELVHRSLNLHVRPSEYNFPTFLPVMEPVEVVTGDLQEKRFAAVAGVVRVTESLRDPHNPGDRLNTVWEPVANARSWSGRLVAEPLAQLLLEMGATASVKDEESDAARAKAQLGRDPGTMNAYQVAATRQKRAEVAKKLVEKGLQDTPHTGEICLPSENPSHIKARGKFFDEALCRRVHQLTHWIVGVKKSLTSQEVKDALTPAEGDPERVAALKLQDILDIIIASWGPKSALKGQLEAARAAASVASVVTESSEALQPLLSAEAFLSYSLRRRLPKAALLSYLSQLDFLRAFPPKWSVTEAYNSLMSTQATYRLLSSLELTGDKAYQGVRINLRAVEDEALVPLFIEVLNEQLRGALTNLREHPTEAEHWAGASLMVMFEKALSWENDGSRIPQTFSVSPAIDSGATASPTRTGRPWRLTPRVAALEGESTSGDATLDIIDRPRSTPPPPPPGNPPQAGLPLGEDGVRRCWNCGSPDHIARNCPQPPNAARLKTVRAGELERQDFPESWREGDPAILKLLADRYGAEEDEEVEEDPSHH